jgi:hypothetical protein
MIYLIMFQKELWKNASSFDLSSGKFSADKLPAPNAPEYIIWVDGVSGMSIKRSYL